MLWDTLYKQFTTALEHTADSFTLEPAAYAKGCPGITLAFGASATLNELVEVNEHVEVESPPKLNVGAHGNDVLVRPDTDTGESKPINNPAPELENFADTIFGAGGDCDRERTSNELREFAYWILYSAADGPEMPMSNVRWPLVAEARDVIV